jgi:hypothetical protein
MSIYGTAPSNYPRIGADNIFRRGTITASTGTGKHAVDWRADRSWSPVDGVQTLEVELAAPAVVDYLFLAVHNLGTIGSVITFQRFAGAWVTAATIAPGDDTPIWCSIDSLPSAKWRIIVASPASTQPAIAVLSAGQAMVLEEGLRPGWSPPIFAASSDVVDSVSENGVLIARSLRRRPDTALMTISDMSETWMHTVWRPVRDRLIRQPWALCWSPLEPHGDCALCWTDGMPSSDDYSSPGLMAISWRLKMITSRDVSTLDQATEVPPPPPPPDPSEIFGCLPESLTEQMAFAGMSDGEPWRGSDAPDPLLGYEFPISIGGEETVNNNRGFLPLLCSVCIKLRMFFSAQFWQNYRAAWAAMEMPGLPQDISIGHQHVEYYVDADAIDQSDGTACWGGDGYGGSSRLVTGSTIVALDAEFADIEINIDQTQPVGFAQRAEWTQELTAIAIVGAGDDLTLTVAAFAASGVDGTMPKAYVPVISAARVGSGGSAVNPPRYIDPTTAEGACAPGYVEANLGSTVGYRIIWGPELNPGTPIPWPYVD